MSYDDALDRAMHDHYDPEPFLASRYADTLRLQVDGEGPIIEAPYCPDFNGTGWAWLTEEQIAAVNADMGPAYLIGYTGEGTWVLQTPDDDEDLTEIAGRVAVGPWRWVEVA